MAKNSKPENVEELENKSNLVGYVRKSNAGGAIKVSIDPKNSHSNSILNCCSDVFAIVCFFHFAFLPGTSDQ